MGQAAADIEREIAQRRTSMTRHINSLEQRVSRDKESLKAEVSPEHLGEVAKSTASAPDSFLREHPMALVGAAAGAGFVLDRLFAKTKADDSRADTRSFKRADSDGGGHSLPLGIAIPGPVQDAISELTAELTGALATHAKQLVRDATDSLKGELKSRVGPSNDSNATPSRGTSHGRAERESHRGCAAGRQPAAVPRSVID